METTSSKSGIRTFTLCALTLLSLLACNSLAPSPTPTLVPTTHSPQPTASPTSTTTLAPTPTTTPDYIPPQHHIGVRQVDGIGEFYNLDTGERFTPRGANYVFGPQAGAFNTLTLKVGVYDSARTRTDFGRLAEGGYNTVRVFLDHCKSGPGCIGDADNVGLNPDYLDNIADMLAAAKESGLFIVFTSNDLPDQGGYAEQANAQSGPTFAGYRNSYYLTPGAVEATRRYWRDLLTGLHQREAATDWVLGWQLLNEQWMFIDQPPLSLTSGMVETTTGIYDISSPEQKKQMVSDGLVYYIDQVKAEILVHDPTALVTMGFFAPEIAAPGWYVETASLLAASDLDFFDFHLYPGSHNLETLVNAFGMQGHEAKPIIMGEYGAFRHVYPDVTSAARAITNWQADSCAYGFDGWLYWTYYPDNASVGDSTWGLVDESGLLFDLLAPAAHPDPCEVVPVSSGNLAYQKPVRASASLPNMPPSNVVDENAASQWLAGSHPPQWIEVDLGQAYAVSEIRLLVAQSPGGNTVHYIWARSASGAFAVVHTFSRFTAEGDWLIFRPEVPIEDIQFIRVETAASPSWVAWSEIQVFGE